MIDEELDLLRKLGDVPEPDQTVFDWAREAAFTRTFPPTRKAFRAKETRRRRPIVIALSAAAAAAVVAGSVAAFGQGGRKNEQPTAVPGNAEITARLSSALDTVSNDILVVTSTASAAPGTETSTLAPGDRLELCEWTQWLSPAVPKSGDTVRLRWHYICGEGQTQDVAVTMPAAQVIPRSGPSDSNLGNSFFGSGRVNCASSQPDSPTYAFVGNLPSAPPTAAINGRPVHLVNPGPGITIETPNGSISSITSEISSGDFVPNGQVLLGGRPALELRFVDRLPGTKIDSTLWIDPATYLPIQQTQTLRGSPIRKITYTFDFVPANAANLANLTVTSPPTAVHTQPSPTFCSIAYLPANLANPNRASR